MKKITWIGAVLAIIAGGRTLGGHGAFPRAQAAEPAAAPAAEPAAAPADAHIRIGEDGKVLIPESLR
jgi:hypothetical protein